MARQRKRPAPHPLATASEAPDENTAAVQEAVSRRATDDEFVNSGLEPRCRFVPGGGMVLTFRQPLADAIGRAPRPHHKRRKASEEDG